MPYLETIEGGIELVYINPEAVRLVWEWISQIYQYMTYATNTGEWIWLILVSFTLILKVVGFRIYWHRLRYQRHEREVYPGQNEIELWLAQSYVGDRTIFLIVGVIALIIGVIVSLIPAVNANQPISFAGWLVYGLIYVFEVSFTILAFRVVTRAHTVARMAMERRIKEGWKPGEMGRRATDPKGIPLDLILEREKKHHDHKPSGDSGKD